MEKAKKIKCICGKLKDHRSYLCRSCNNMGGPSKKFYAGLRIGCLVLKDYIGKRFWIVECDCGVKIKTRTDHIKRRKSCGCRRDACQFQRVSDKIFITNIKLNHYKQSAKNRKFEWKLGNDEFYNLISGKCNYCGSHPSQLLKRGSHLIYTNGIDRIDSKIGYVSSNVVSCCRFCNFAKSNSTLDEFNAWIKRLITFQTEKYEHLDDK